MRAQEPAHERVHGAHAGCRAGPHAAFELVGDLVDDEVDEVVVRAQRLTFDPPGTVLALVAVALQRGTDVVHDHRVLLAIVFGVGEREREQVVLDELGDRPIEAVHALRAVGDVRLRVPVTLAGRCEHADRLERAGDEPEGAIAVALLLVELRVVVIEEEEVLALHVEDERVGVGRVLAEHARVEERVEEKGRVRRLRRNAGDARDVDVRAAGAVDEVEVGDEHGAVPAEPDRELALHAVEEQRLVATPRRWPVAPPPPDAAARRPRARPAWW